MKAALITAAVIVGFAPLIAAIIIFVKNKCRINWFYYENKKKHRRHLAENKTALEGQIVMIGDSIIDFYNTDKVYKDSPIKVYNRGISGDSSRNMLSRLETSTLSIHPKAVIMLIGTNDIDRHIEDDETIDNIRSAIEKTRASGVEHIFVESLYPVNINVDKLMVGVRTNEHINALNVRLQALCEELSVRYVNIHDSLTDDKGLFKKEYTIDGLHPSEEGYKVVTYILRDYICEVENEKI